MPNEKTKNKTQGSNFKDEILVKGIDGKLYILKGDQLIAYTEQHKKVDEINYADKVEQILSQSKINFDNKVLQEQFYNIVLSRLKGVRDDLETKEYLIKSTGVGGLDLEEGKALNVLNLINKALEDGLKKEEEKISKKDLSTSPVRPRALFEPEPQSRRHGREVKTEEGESVIVQKQISRQRELEKLVDQIITKIKKDFSKDLEPRLRTIILTYLKDIRDRRETRDVLEKKVELGGMSFVPERAIKLVDFIDQVEAESKKKDELLKKESADSADKERPAVQKVVVPKIRELSPKIEKKKIAEEKVEKEYLAPPPPAIIEKKYIFKKPVKPTIQFIKPKPVVEEKSKIQSKIKPIRPLDTVKAPIKAPSLQVKKPQIQDIKYKPKLVGPIDELKSLTVSDFRKLSSDPEVAVEKIQNKINLLDEESFIKKIKGIKAWQQSPINKVYLSIGQASILENKSIDQIISEHQQNTNNLNKEEFNAIMELNKSLRF